MGNTGQFRARVALLDDHQLFGASVAASLRVLGYEVTVPALTHLDEVVAELAARPPDVALLDLDLGAFGTGLDLLPFLVGDLGARVLIVSGAGDEAVIGRCLREGAWGWVAKDSPLDRLLDVVHETSMGRPVLADAERDRLMRTWRERRTSEEEALAPFGRLSEREAAVLSMLQDGKSVDRIAAELFVSDNTVRSHVRAILRKLDVNSQLEAVAKASRAGWTA